MRKRIHIGVVTDQPIFRTGVTEALGAIDSFTIVAHGQTVADVFRMARDAAVDILLLEIDIPGVGIDAVGTICRAMSGAKVLVLTAVDDEAAVIDALRLGARGYILKDVTGADLARAIVSVHEGEYYLTPALASRVVPRLLMQGAMQSGSRNLNALTSREREVLGFLSRGLTNREIALKLDLSIKTVKQHTSLLFAKMGVRNRVEAAAVLDDAGSGGMQPQPRWAH
jgi:DNA-binding NarL/FixJ family response regulator